MLGIDQCDDGVELGLLFGSIPARFESDFTLEESIERLSAATQPLAFGSFFEEGAVGEVTESRVVLQRVIPAVGNSFKPFFKGSFRLENERVVLDGRFTMLLFVKIFTGVFVAFSLFFAALGIVQSAQGDPKGHGIAIVGTAMAAFCMVLVWLSRWLARNDVQWLSSLITTALCKEPLPSSRIVDPSATRTRQMIVLQIFLVLAALCSAVSAATGIAMIETGMDGPEIILHTWWSRLAAGMGAILLAGIVWGIHQRSISVWRIGMAALPIAGLLAIAQMIYYVALMFPANHPATWFVFAFVTAGGALVTVCWTYWWKKQREYFS